MTQPTAKPGIYLNAEKLKALRASTPFAAPTQPGWELISEDTMIGMVTIRQIASERGLVKEPEKIEWTGRSDI
ncbi:MAG: hypothetical protein U0531_15235 [Dehalococcoidia bacterium]